MATASEFIPVSGRTTRTSYTMAVALYSPFRAAVAKPSRRSLITSADGGRSWSVLPPTETIATRAHRASKREELAVLFQHSFRERQDGIHQSLAICFRLVQLGIRTNGEQGD